MGFIGKQPSKTAITSSDITDGVVTADKLASDSVTTAKIADNGVTTAKINADAVTDAKIADDVVGSEHLTAGEVDTTALGADAVTAAKIADDAISDEHLDPTAITGQTAETSAADDDLILLSDTSASAALKKMTRSNFLSGVGGTNTPSFSVTQGSGQDLSNATATKLAFNTEVFDTDSAFDHSSNYRFTVPSGKGGKYFFYAQATLQAVQDADANSIMIYKNGSVFQTAMNTNGYYDTSEISIVMDLSAGDYIEVYFEHNRGTTDDVAGGKWYGFKLI